MNSAAAIAASACITLLLPCIAVGGDSLPARDDLDRLQGTWIVSAAEQGGKPLEAIKGGTLVFDAERFALKTAAGNEFKGTVRLDPGASPRTIDFQLSNGAVWLAIYSLTSGSFRINYVEASDGATRPAVFATSATAPGTVIAMRKTN